MIDNYKILLMNNEYLCIAVYSYMNTVLGQKIESAFKLHDFHLGSSTVHQLEFSVEADDFLNPYICTE